MKSFWIAFTSALIAGVLVFLFQDQYSSWKRDRQYAAEFRIEDDVIRIGPTELAKISSPGWSDVRFAVFKAKNTGVDTLNGAKIFIDSRISGKINVLASGNVPEMNDAPRPFTLRPSGEGLELALPLLQPGDEAKIWVAYSCCEMFRASSLTPNLKLYVSSSDDYQDEDPLGNWFFYIVIVAVAFIGGGIVDSVITTSMAKRRGFDLVEILKLPVSEPAKDD